MSKLKSLSLRQKSPQSPTSQGKTIGPNTLTVAPEARGQTTGALQGALGNTWMNRAMAGTEATSFDQTMMRAVQMASAGINTGTELLPGMGSMQILREAMQGQATASHPEVDALNAIGRGGGTPLPPAILDRMERAFDHDFSHVRIHTGSSAARAARALNAQAFAVGRDIHFGSGGLQPSSPENLHLLAHELQHIVQADEGRLPPNPGGGLAVSSPDDPHELEAERIAGDIDAILHAGPSLDTTQINDPDPTQAPLSSAGTNDEGLISRRKPSASQPGLGISVSRKDTDEEMQRLEAIAQVVNNKDFIITSAADVKITPIAIAGAILWEALENPNHLINRLVHGGGTYGPGKVHVEAGSEAEKVEKEGRVPASKDEDERWDKLQDIRTSILYIAAIMARHADNYQTIAQVNIRQNAPVLCTLYQGGHSETRAQALAEKRKTDPSAQPQPGDEMGPWVELHAGELAAFLQATPTASSADTAAQGASPTPTPQPSEPSLTSHLHLPPGAEIGGLGAGLKKLANQDDVATRQE